MSKEEKIDKILEMSKELMILKLDSISNEDLDKLYIETKLVLETFKELEGGSNNE